MKPPQAKKGNNKKQKNTNTQSKKTTQQTTQSTFSVFFLSEVKRMWGKRKRSKRRRERKKFACIPNIPLISILKKTGVTTIFSSGPKRQNILCGANETRPKPNKKKGIYRYQCPCLQKSVYVGQTSIAYDLRWNEHGNAIRTENWSHSGISQHHQICENDFDPLNASIIATVQSKSKKILVYDLKIRDTSQ